MIFKKVVSTILQTLKIDKETAAQLVLETDDSKDAIIVDLVRRKEVSLMKKYTLLSPEDAILGKTNYFYAKNDQHARHILSKSEFSKLTTKGINFNLYKFCPKTNTEKFVRYKENYLQKHGLGKPSRKVKKKNKK